MPTFSTPEPIDTAVTVAGARVHITASDRSDTVVLVEPLDRSTPMDVTVADRTKVELTSGRLVVETTVPGDRRGSIAITIDLPTGSHLLTRVAHTNVHVDGLLGACELHGEAIRAQLDGVATLRADLANGEIAVGSIDGNATVSGSTVAARIGRAGADIELTTSGGSLDVDHADGGVTVTSGDCPIRIGRLVRGRSTLMNASGDIEIGIDGSSVAQVVTRSDRGSVRNTVPAPDRSGADGDEVAVDARTRHGDIVIHPAGS